MCINTFTAANSIWEKIASWTRVRSAPIKATHSAYVIFPCFTNMFSVYKQICVYFRIYIYIFIVYE